MTTKPPPWLADRLGAPSRRGVTAGRCRDCKASVLTGWDDDVAATRVSVDPTPLTAMGEALALLCGHQTYELKVRKAGLALWRRDHWQIKGRPAGAFTGYPKADIVANHVCGASFTQFQAPSVFTKGERVNYDECPF